MAWLAVVIPVLSYAHPDCPGVREYKLNGNFYLPAAPWVYEGGLQAQCDEAAALWDAAPASNGYELIGTTVTITNGGQAAQCTLDYKSLSNGQQFHPVWAVSTRVAVECPPPEQCSEEKESRYTVRGLRPAEYCDTSRHCKVKSGSGLCLGEGTDKCVQQITVTTESCDAQAPAGDAAHEPGEKCVEGGGVVVCKNDSDNSCQYVNDEYVCTNPLGDDKCVRTPNGALFCVASAGMPPAPDDGTPGVPADPDAQVHTTDGGGGGNTYNYYNNTTVNNSSRPSGEGSNPDGSGVTPGSGDGEGEGEGEGGDPGAVGLPELEEGQSVGSTAGGFFAEASQAPIVAALSGLGASVPGGSCPTYAVEIFDHSYSVNPMCDYWEDFAGILSAVMLVGWGLLAARILFTA